MCLQICKNPHFFVSINNLDHILMTIFDISEKSFSNDITTLNDKRSKISGTHIKTILGTQLFFLWSSCRCLQYFLSIYIAEEHESLNPKVVCVKIIFFRQEKCKYLAKTKTDWNWRYTETHKYSKEDPKENFGP